MVGLNRLIVIEGTRLAEAMGAGEHDEGFYCNYGVNEEFCRRFEQAGLRVSAFGEQGEIRAVELDAHPFYLATLFQPQLTSVATARPHPLLLAYLRAVARHAPVAHGR
jgi:CTP synthase